MTLRRAALIAASALLIYASLPLVRLNIANAKLLRAVMKGERPSPALDHEFAQLGALTPRARLAQLRGDNSAGISLLQEAIASGNHPDAQAMLGEALMRAGRFAEAANVYKSIPHSEDYFIEQVRRAAAQSRWNDAVRPAEMAVAIRPTSASVQRTWGSVQVSALHDYDGAIASYQRAAAIGVADGYLQIEIAHVQQMARHDDDALKTLDAFHGDHPMAHAIRGAIYLKRGRTDDALRELHRAVELDPNNVWALFDYGNALCAAKRASEAREYWQLALHKDPGFSPALAARCDG